MGRWSDAYGRRPFLVLCFIFAGLPVIVLTLHIQYHISLYYYFPVMVRGRCSARGWGGCDWHTLAAAAQPAWWGAAPTMASACWPSVARLGRVQILNTAFSSVSIAMSSIADVIQPHNRAPAFGVTMSSFSIGILIGPTLGGHLTPLQARHHAGAGCASCLHA